MFYPPCLCMFTKINGYEPNFSSKCGSCKYRESMANIQSKKYCNFNPHPKFTPVKNWFADEEDEDVSNPKHYTSHPSGVECIEIAEHMGFNLGNAQKYLWRAGLKSDDASKDLKKAIWYIEREIQRINK